MNDAHADLVARWRPSADQIRQADALLAAGFDAVFTCHLLHGKRFGVWTLDVNVVHLDGVFNQQEMSRYLRSAESLHDDDPDVPVTGGYTWHPEPGHWAVFEDVSAIFHSEASDA